MIENQNEQKAFEARLSRQIAAYHDAALLYAAVKLGLPDRLAARASTAEQLAEALGLSAPHLERFLRGLVTLGVCEERPDRTFALTSSGRSLTSGSPSRLAEKVQIVVGQYWRPWSDLASCLQSGKPSFAQVFGMGVRDWRREHAEQGALFDSYVAKETLAQVGSIVEALDVSGVKTVAEIGGGYGGLLAAILHAHPHLTGILLDQPHIVSAAKPFLHAHGVAEHVQCIGGDILQGVPVEADLYVLKAVLQNWDDAGASAILANCRKVMPDGAKLLIIEHLLPERAADDAAAIMLDLHMMAITGGHVRSLAEIETLLAQAGLALSKVSSTRAGLSILVAEGKNEP
jgi:SAM-dependent methyltransferase